jgi:peptidoglycan LD-endopeptidase CwlK
MKNSRDLNDLIPLVKIMAENFIRSCKAIGVDVLITSTMRDKESQNALYAQGRTAPGRIVTNAKGGESFHNYGCAFDFVPIVNGKAQWDDIRTFEKCGAIAESLGLEWAGNWKKFREMAHCQFTGGLTLKDLQNGREIK